jgi:hypothetical protein
MAISDLAALLARPGFAFDHPGAEAQAADAALARLDDAAPEVAALATKCLGLFARAASEERLRAVAAALGVRAAGGKSEQARDAAVLALKAALAEVKSGPRGATAAAAAAPALLTGLSAPAPAVAADCLDVLAEAAARHGGALAPPLRAQLVAAVLPELDAARAGVRRRAAALIAALAPHLDDDALAELAGALFARLEAPRGGRDAACAHPQAAGALARGAGRRLAPHLARGLPALLGRLASAGEGDEDEAELLLAAVEAAVARAPAGARPLLAEISAAALRLL